MRKAQKQQAEEFVELLGQVHKEIEKAVSEKRNEDAQSLLVQCQQGAIALGELIEKTEGEGTATIPLLEAYCETLYLAHQDIDAFSGYKKDDWYECLQSELVEIADSVNKDIPLKKEIVFFPYKASMWDSLESIYLAAKADPLCDVYCVPIPYFDRNADGTLGEIHYEGGDYPKEIEILNWEEYALEKRRPDIIYIHNPYDDWNLVTCVHPRYFSRNLKKYTDMLVYVPYFVLKEISPSDQKEIDKINHFCFVPGITYADKVIVQSDNIRKIYINEYRKAAEKRGIFVSNEQLEEKIEGWGSPKFDKIKEASRETVQIPEEWKSHIIGADGLPKKIIFYNTSVTSFLAFREKMLEKMKEVFEFFKKQKKVVLLWRPHPLISTTIQSMCPDLWEEYKNLTEEYQRENFGIYDDTSDIDRAIVLSDGYYGDVSSVVELYQKTGKPIMIQNVECKSENSSVILPTHMIAEKDDAWFTAAYTDGIFHIDLKNGDSALIREFPFSINKEQKDTWAAIYKAGKKIILTPNLDNKTVAVYDMLQKRYKLLEIEDIAAGRGIYTTVLEYKDTLFAVSGYGEQPMILQIDPVKEKIAGYFKIPLEKPENKKVRLFGKNVFCTEDCILMPMATEPAILAFHIDNKHFEKYTFKEIQEGISAACYDGTYIWLSDRTGKLYKWNQKTQEEIFIADTMENTKENMALKEQVQNIKGFAESFMYYNHCLLGKQQIFFLPGRGKNILMIEKDSGRLHYAADEIAQTTEGLIKSNLTAFCHYKDEACAYSVKYNKFLFPGTEKEALEIQYNREASSVISNRIMERCKKFSVEDKYISCGLEDFVFYTAAQKNTEKEKQEKTESIGCRIHDIITV